ncbi:alpha/beta fold hydrolase [Roseovarius atlanticus]|uniref:alpha/beta fold hydrolase n=1 Tax=Roseovarius atlanticus TaxID=1641875 RepID=UPI001C951DE5|nr:alpha/beta hydrolase [Roseovarius atlanticus]MBY5987704.1 alpha/beta hydrolase [Roseovarius atlanticus]MBY6123095.1 alpha/beta hydrolase [Roseovarius atlanticus]MBY6147591.1 alpha/beta hydrolase [Roseovarius atlanticus]
MTSTTLPRSERAGLAVLEAGAGRPVVLLHGVGLNAEAWGAQIDGLSGGCRVIAPDMPGHGQSRRLSGQPSLEEYVQAVLPLLDSLTEPAVIAGHSMGALIAVELAALAPAKVCAVAALNAVFERAPEAAAAIRERARRHDGETAPNPTQTLERWFGSEVSPERAACDRWLRAVDPAGYKAAYTAFARAEAPRRETVRAIACPALFATGALDPNSTPQMSRAMADLAPDGRVLVIDDAAHMMPMTHADRVLGALVALAREVWP